MIHLFTPVTAGTVNVASTAASSRVPIGTKGSVLRIKNADATNTAFVEFGDVTVTASLTTSMPLGPGDITGITRAAGWTHMAVICAATATVYCTPGDGV